MVPIVPLPVQMFSSTFGHSTFKQNHRQMKHVNTLLTDLFLHIVTVAVLQVVPGETTAQDGHLDMSFNSSDTGLNGDGSGPGSSVSRIIDLGEEGYLLRSAGPFYNGQHVSDVYRISTAGVLLDDAWGPVLTNGSLLDLASSPQGGFYAGGWFTSSTNPVMTNIMKLTSSGELDTVFYPQIFPNGQILEMFPSSDGSVLVSGSFTMVGDSSRNGWAHFAAEGSLTGLDLGSDVNDHISCALFLDDGALLIGGAFTSVQGRTMKRLARFDPTGQLDTAFALGGVPNGPVSVLEQDFDGSIYVAGSFTTYAGVPRKYLTKVQSNGALDTAFDPGQSTNGVVQILRAGVDGSLLILGGFNQYQGVMCDGIAVLGNNGTVIQGLGDGNGYSWPIKDVVYQDGGSIVIAGTMNFWMGLPCRRMEVLHTDGTVDPTFNACTGANDFVAALELYPDGKILIGGEFTQYNGVARGRVARLEPNGSLDVSFDPGSGANGQVSSIDFMADSRILLGGSFSRVQGMERGGIARLFPNGDLDPSFLAPFTGTVHCIRVLPDEKILVGGSFHVFGDTINRTLIKLNADGSVDGSFTASYDVHDWPVRRIGVQPDGRIIVTGQFTNLNGTGIRGVMRLNADGSPDGNFDVGIGANGDVRGLAVQDDGRILIAGNFTTVDGVPSARVARLGSDGSVDVAFSDEVGQGATPGVNAISVDSFGRIVVAGSYGYYDGLPTWPVVRLLPNGARDPNFYASQVQGGSVFEMVQQDDGVVLAVGAFTDLDNVPRNRIARLGIGWVGLGPAKEIPSGLSVWPNPALRSVTVSASTPLGEVLVFDGKGRLVKSTRVATESVVIPLTELPAGLYTITAHGLSKRLVKN